MDLAQVQKTYTTIGEIADLADDGDWHAQFFMDWFLGDPTDAAEWVQQEYPTEIDEQLDLRTTMAETLWIMLQARIARFDFDHGHLPKNFALRMWIDFEVDE